MVMLKVIDIIVIIFFVDLLDYNRPKILIPRDKEVEKVEGLAVFEPGVRLTGLRPNHLPSPTTTGTLLVDLPWPPHFFLIFSNDFHCVASLAFAHVCVFARLVVERRKSSKKELQAPGCVEGVPGSNLGMRTSTQGTTAMPVGESTERDHLRSAP